MIGVYTYKNNIKRVGSLCLALFCVLFCGAAVAQNDTALVARQGRTEGTVHTVAVEKPHSAKKALILSAVLPGAGQVYNGQAWKIPIVYAGLGGVAYYTYSNYTQMRLYKDEYLYRVNNNGATLHPDDVDISGAPTSNIYNLYEDYNKTFQLSVIIAAAVYGLNLLDAYVFGHLYDFQITDDLTLNIAPELLPYNKIGGTFGTGLGFAPAVGIRLRF